MDLLTLPDGRVLEVEVSGPDGGPVLLFHHGTPGGSTQLDQMARVVHDRGHRLVTWSRAGYGASSRRTGRDVASEASDAATLLDHLGVETCVVAGWSGGGPHALACGAVLAHRVRAVLCIAGVAPFAAAGLDFLADMGEENVDEFGAAVAGEDALRAYLDEQRDAMLEITGPQIAEEMATLLPPVDKAQLSGSFGDFLAEEFRQAVSHGVDGWLDDDLAFTRPWGFAPADVTVPTYLWQGSDDLMVPFAHGEWLAERIPGVTAHLEQGEGHLSIGLGAMERMFDELLGHS